jgi:hypothetical protein
MPKYCPNCGSRVETDTAKFCSECGFELQDNGHLIDDQKEDQLILEHEPDDTLAIRPDLLGKNLEIETERILRAQGWQTRRNEWIHTVSGIRREIDIFAEKTCRDGKQVLGVECKNHTTPLSVKEISNFFDVLRDCGIKNGRVVAYGGFSESARKLAEHYGIQLWDGDDFNVQYIRSVLGRDNAPSERFEYAMPENIGFEEATRLDLRNPESVYIPLDGASLIWRPYYRIGYTLDERVGLPDKSSKRIHDEGYCILDALDGEVLLPSKSRSEDGLAGTIKGFVSNDNPEERHVVKELQGEPTHDYEITRSKDFRMERLPDNVGMRAAKRLAIQRIQDANSKAISYKMKVGKDDRGVTEYRSARFDYVPSKKNIILKRTQIIYSPKWEIEFQSGKRTYNRHVLANSRVTISDDISTCPYHHLKNLLKFTTVRSVAVCEECGDALCDKHVHQCPVCGRWLCDEHSVVCHGCGRHFCPEHLTNQCSICSQRLCDDCVQTCQICGALVGPDHSHVCSKCGATVCDRCSIVQKKLFRKEYLCVNCASS